MRNFLRLFGGVLFISFLWGGQCLAQPLPLDSTVRSGKLANGLTYYIKHNEEPKNHAYLTIVNNVGSVLEDDDQQGLAHFMEHMNFNGTKHFPKKALINYLERAGVRFGADLNAHTSFNETVYVLPIPLDDKNLLPRGLDILRDWAHEATLDPQEVDKERGVILEEERMHRGLSQRIQKKILPVITNHSRYSDRIPIGKINIIKNGKAATLKRFRDDWYRPDLQAVIVVGDVDVDQVEGMIKSKFSDLRNPVPERNRPVYTIPLIGKNQFVAVADSEQPNEQLQILFKRRARPIRTEQDYKHAVIGILMNQMLAFRRYQMTSTDSNPSYLGMNFGKDNLLANVSMFGFSVTAKEGKLKEAFFQSWGLINRILQNGFTRDGLDRAKKSLLHSYEQQLKEKDHIPSKSLAQEYQQLFLKGEAAPGITWEYNFVKKIMPEITVSDVDLLYRSCLQPHDRDIMLLAPASVKTKLPVEKDIVGWMAQIAGKKASAFEDRRDNKPLIKKLPAPGKIVARREFKSIGVTELELSNGVKVVLKPTKYKNDEIRFSAFKPGGLSLYGKSDYDNASNATDILGQMGLGDFSPVELDQKLTGKSAAANVDINGKQEVSSGGGSQEDIETALKLLYLKFTAPRKDTLLFHNIMEQIKESVAKRYTNPQMVFMDTVQYILGDHNYRYAPPTMENVDKLNLDKMYAIYKDRFADASGFTFVVVGNFKVDSIAPLIQKYIGALPSFKRKEKARKLNVGIPSGKMVKKVYAGKENKAIVDILLHGRRHYNHIESLKVRALGQILELRLLDVLRENAGEVYSPSANGSLIRGEHDHFVVQASFSCSPKNADHLIQLTEQVFKSMREKGVTSDELEKFKAAYQKQFEKAVQTNDFWMGYLTNHYRYGGKWKPISSYIENLNKVTCKSLHKAAGTYLSTKNEKVFELLPKKK